MTLAFSPTTRRPPSVHPRPRSSWNHPNQTWPVFCCNYGDPESCRCRMGSWRTAVLPGWWASMGRSNFAGDFGERDRGARRVAATSMGGGGGWGWGRAGDKPDEMVRSRRWSSGRERRFRRLGCRWRGGGGWGRREKMAWNCCSSRGLRDFWWPAVGEDTGRDERRVAWGGCWVERWLRADRWQARACWVRGSRGCWLDGISLPSQRLKISKKKKNWKNFEKILKKF